MPAFCLRIIHRHSFARGVRLGHCVISKKIFLLFLLLSLLFLYLPLKLFRAIMLLLKRQNPLPLVILLKPKSIPQLPWVKIVQLKVAQLHSVKVQKVMMVLGDLALGRGAQVTGTIGGSPQGDATAIGNYSVASGTGAVALGLRTKATGENAVATGGNGTTEAKGKDTVAIGNSTKATGEESIAMGGIARSTGKRSVAVGYRLNLQALNLLPLVTTQVQEGQIQSLLAHLCGCKGQCGSR
jgi:hypothetical protein